MTAPSGVSIKGDQHTHWGAASVFTWTKNGTTYTAQIVKNCRKTVDGEETTVGDKDSITRDHILFDDRNEAEVEVCWRDNEVYPARRDVATVGGITGLVTKVEDTWDAKALRGCRVTVKKFDGVDYGAVPASSEEASSEVSGGSAASGQSSEVSGSSASSQSSQFSQSSQSSESSESSQSSQSSQSSESSRSSQSSESSQSSRSSQSSESQEPIGDNVRIAGYTSTMFDTTGGDISENGEWDGVILRDGESLEDWKLHDGGNDVRAINGSVFYVAYFSPFAPWKHLQIYMRVSGVDSLVWTGTRSQGGLGVYTRTGGSPGEGPATVTVENVPA